MEFVILALVVATLGVAAAAVGVAAANLANKDS